MQHSKLVSNPLLFAVIALILFATVAVPASAADLTVGTQGQFNTIQQAVDAAKPGDTVRIAPGTYTENVVVNKQLTITAISGRPTVQAADPSKDVFLLSSPGVHIDGLTITGGASGVEIQGVSNCVVTNVVAQDNVRGVYLANSTQSEISNSNLAGNGYGVYGDGSSNNTLSSNVATGEKGNGNTLGDGIFLNYGDSNTVTRNNLSANHVFGISLYSSTRNVISNNTINDNDRVGIRLGPGSNDNTVTFNTIARNSVIPQPVAETFPASGILIVSATGNQIYLNNFISQPNAIVGASAAILNSPEKMVYTYNSVEQTGYMSNYYSDYNGTATQGNGIGSQPSAYGDKYPLVQSVASYGNIILASAVTPTPSPTATLTSTATSGNQSATGTKLPGFEVTSAVAGLSIAVLLLLSRKNRAR
jgi:parallel beta-helix repeat protein